MHCRGSGGPLAFDVPGLHKCTCMLHFTSGLETNTGLDTGSLDIHMYTNADYRRNLHIGLKHKGIEL